MLDNDLPKIIKDNCLNFKVPKDENIWSLSAPTTKIKLSKLLWQMDIPFWRYNGKKYSLTPNQVLSDIKKYNYHYKRILNSDLKYPVDIMKNQNGKWESLDGLHRTAKAKLLNLKEINVRKIDYSMIKHLIK